MIATTTNKCWLAGLMLAAMVGAAQASPEPGVIVYHVGVDGRQTFPSGTYAGQANPNANRLTFFLSHTYTDTPTNNHFHRIGSYVLTGPAATPTVGFSTNDRIPEPFQGDDGLALLPGSGPFAGKLVSGLGPAALPGDAIEEEYGLLPVAPMDELFPSDGVLHPDQAAFPGVLHPEHYLLNTSGGVYKTPVANSTIGLVLTALSPGLSIHNTAGGALFASGVGSTETLGTGANWLWEPVYAVDAAAAPGSQYSATFVLKDLSSNARFGDSAPFSFDFVVPTAPVPEPSSVVIAAVGATILGVLVCWKRR